MSRSQLNEQQRHYEVVARAIDYIRKHARSQPSLGEIAAGVNLSEYHLQRVFAAWAGISPKRFLQYLTKEYARDALRQSHDLLSVALDTGLSGPSRLHDLMITCEGMTPGEIKARGEGVTINHGVAATPFGDGLFGWTSRGICFLAFLDGDEARQREELKALWPTATLVEERSGAQELAARVFPVDPQPGKLHLVLQGSNFQLKVWEALLKTHPSQLVSYGQLAELAGSPKAHRAVGSAMAANNIGFLIPCHRVIRGSGEGSSYRWGETRKRAIQCWEAGHEHSHDHYPA